MDKVIQTDLMSSLVVYKDKLRIYLDRHSVGTAIYHSFFDSAVDIFVKENLKDKVSFYRVLLQSRRDIRLDISGRGQYSGLLLLQKGKMSGDLNGTNFISLPFHYGVFTLGSINLALDLKAGNEYLFIFVNYNSICLHYFEEGFHPLYKELLRSINIKKDFYLYPKFLPANVSMILLADNLHYRSSVIRQDYYFVIKGLQILEVAIRPLLLENALDKSIKDRGYLLRYVYDFAVWVLELGGYTSRVIDYTRRNRISANHFRGRFFDIFDMTPQRFLISVRMSRAQELLASGHHDLKWIARQVGYNKKSSLQIQFKRFNEMSS